MAATESVDHEGDTLQGSLGLVGATALAVTIVVGSGALVLPGIAYAEIGDDALAAWIAAAVISVPLLLIFARLGATNPGAGGIAGFAQAAFGRRLAAGVEVLIMGTFGLGMPAIALTGGGYVTAIPGADELSAAAAAVVLVLIAAGVTLVGVKLSTGVQIVLALIMTIGLIAVGILGVTYEPSATQLPDPDLRTLMAGIGGIGLVFFAFTGWEMLSFTTEEYRNPRRDFPRVVLISFVVVVAMYLLLALAVQAVLPAESDSTVLAPVEAVVAATVSPGAAALVAALGVVIIVANLIGAMWGASRLVMSSAREGLLPRRLARLSDGNPRRAVIVCAVAFTAVITTVGLGWVTIGQLLTVAGQNFFLLYLVCSLAYTALNTGGRRIFGVIVSVALAAIAVTAFGVPQLIYAAALLCTGFVITGLREKRSPAL